MEDIWKEIRVQWAIAGPMMGVNLVQISIQVASIMLVGHLGELALSGTSLATSFSVVSGFSVMLGMASALDTLCGQAYGAKQFHLLGIYLQRAILVLSITCIPIAIIWLNMSPLLRLLGQDSGISAVAGEYSKWLVPGLFAQAFLQPLVKFLQTQSIVMPMLICSSCSLLLHLSLCWVLIYKVGMGVEGAALSTSIANWVNVALLLGYMWLWILPRNKSMLSLFSSQVTRDIKPFLKLAIPSAAMICLEYWVFELLILFSGILPNPELQTSAFSVLINTVTFFYMIPYGLSAAASTRVSNELGEGNPRVAKFACGVTLGFAVVDAVIVSSALVILRRVLGRAFSDEEEVVDLVSSLAPFVAVVAALDAFQGVLSGIARGCGWQMIGAFGNLGAHYLVGIPIACILGFGFGYGGTGLWIGMLFGCGSQVIIFSIKTATTKWEDEAKAAWERVHYSPQAHLLQ